MLILIAIVFSGLILAHAINSVARLDPVHYVPLWALCILISGVGFRIGRGLLASAESAQMTFLLYPIPAKGSNYPSAHEASEATLLSFSGSSFGSFQSRDTDYICSELSSGASEHYDTALLVSTVSEGSQRFVRIRNAHGVSQACNARCCFAADFREKNERNNCASMRPETVFACDHNKYFVPWGPRQLDVPVERDILPVGSTIELACSGMSDGRGSRCNAWRAPGIIGWDG